MDKFKIYKFNNENLLLQLSIYVPVKNIFIFMFVHRSRHLLKPNKLFTTVQEYIECNI